jgi:3-oxoacyl-[acyl-carrier protein] reductase
MSDFLVELGANPRARRLIQSLGLPLPIPQKLARSRGPAVAQPLDGKAVVVGQAGFGALADVLAPALAEAGATPYVTGPCGPGTAWADAGEAWGRPPHALAVDEVPDKLTAHALVLDATGARSVEDLRQVYAFFHPRMRSLGRNGRCVVLARPASEARSVAEASARRGLDGFVRALSKEVGGKGVTANLLIVHDGAERGVAGPLRFLLSPGSAFITGQPLAITPAEVPTRLPWTAPLAGKVAVVTGAARGIGAATAETLAREGCKVLCLDRPADAEPLSQVAAAIGGVPIAADVTAPDCAAKIMAALAPGEGLDIIVHNAGITRDKTLANMDTDRWDLTLAVNLQAILSLTEALEPHLRDGGRIIALSSVSGIAGNFGQTNYSLSKAGVVGFVEAAAPLYASRGITVNGIAPGFIETRLTAAIPVATREAGRRLSALSQGGQPVDIAEAVTFFASPGSFGVTGRILRVCGGALIGA